MMLLVVVEVAGTVCEGRQFQISTTLLEKYFW